MHDDDYLVFKNINTSDGLLILDIGANRGQSIVSFKQVLPKAKIVSFEANTFFEPVLKEVATWYQHVKVNLFGLGANNSVRTLYVPVVDGIFYWEAASIKPEDYFSKSWVKDMLHEFGTNLTFQKYSCDIRTLDSCAIESADIVKIDVEGAEMEVVSSMELITKINRPIFMIENSDWSNVTDWMVNRSYVNYMFKCNENKLVPLQGACANSFYIPSEYKGDLISIMKD